MIKHITAGCFLLNSKNELFLIHKKFSNGTTAWVCPKGHVEGNETLEQAALRETGEETGYTNVKIIKKLKTYTFEYQHENENHQKELTWFQASLLSDDRMELSPSENEVNSVIEMRWVSLVEAKNLLTFKDDKEVLGFI